MKPIVILFIGSVLFFCLLQFWAIPKIDSAHGKNVYAQQHAMCLVRDQAAGVKNE